MLLDVFNVNHSVSFQHNGRVGHIYKFDPTLNFEVGAPSAGHKMILACDNMGDCVSLVTEEISCFKTRHVKYQ